MAQSLVVSCVLAAVFVNTIALSESENRQEHSLDTLMNAIDSTVYVEKDIPINEANLIPEFKKLKGLYASGYFGGAHNLSVGHRTSRDRVLYQATVYKPYKHFRIVETDLVISPTAGNQNLIITYVEGRDVHPNPKDAGYASVIRGGPGENHVTVHLESQRGHGIKYYVRIWGN